MKSFTDWVSGDGESAVLILSINTSETTETNSSLCHHNLPWPTFPSLFIYFLNFHEELGLSYDLDVSLFTFCQVTNFDLLKLSRRVRSSSCYAVASFAYFMWDMFVDWFICLFVQKTITFEMVLVMFKSYYECLGSDCNKSKVSCLDYSSSQTWLHWLVTNS